MSSLAAAPADSARSAHFAPQEANPKNPTPSQVRLPMRAGSGEDNGRKANTLDPELRFISDSPPSPTDGSPTRTKTDVLPRPALTQRGMTGVPRHTMKKGGRSSVEDASAAAALLRGVVDEVDVVPKGYLNYWNERVDEEQVEELGESEEFERVYMEQQAKQLPFRTSTTEWTMNTAAGTMVCVMAWGPIMMVLCFVVGGALGFGFAIAHDLWRMRKKETAATKQKQKLDQLMRWADFHFPSSQNQLQLIFKVILEYQVLARLGAFSKTARAQLKLLYAFLSRDDVGRCLWLYLDFFEGHFRIMTRSEIAMCSLVCSVSVECVKSLRKKKPPPVMVRMMHLVEDPMAQRIFDTGKNAAAFRVRQDQKLKEMDAIMYADAAKEVQRHILRGGELLDSHHATAADAPRESDEETEEESSEAADRDSESVSALDGGAARSTHPGSIAPFATTGDLTREGTSAAVSGVSLPCPGSPRPPSEAGEEQDALQRVSSAGGVSPSSGAAEAALLGPLKPLDNFNLALSPTPADFHATAPTSGLASGVAAHGSERGSLVSRGVTAAGPAFSRFNSRATRTGAAGAEASAAMVLSSQRGSFASEAGDEQSPRLRRRQRSSISHKDLKKTETGPPRLFKSYQDLVDFDVNLKHQTPIGLYEFEFLDEKKPQDPNDPNWELVVDQKAIKVYKFISPNSPVVLVKAYAELDGIPMPVLCHEIRDISMRLQWDSTFEDYRVIEPNVSHNEIIYCLMKAPFPVSNRDFLQWRRTEVDMEAGVVKMLMRSASHPSIPERPGVVRAETILSGYIMEQRGPNSSSLFIVAQTDVKGLIPKWVVNTTAARAPVGWVDNLKKACAKYMKEHGTDVPPSSLVSS
ncbi:putative phosphatidylcholine transfer protein [Neospora caninum Liverpool]|uniref:Phosphatidylcholine transfer protein n=1 Tax=Neospora caninum (strain Liverpool) TaxID=572307 RepID=F0VHY9_NEOCL|nr:putative phosphatidylcholine transfer protein [Neospora caninum Liverpool]CBZ53350.1 putative phosphatidylcholine transfer protein [Neospora caninum Liverpool]CEL67336.1 TPA: phosphatidylcholine transfer protein, putative [Neospora caninum Liverpool]|eukprot:XP_003883382.1 putative phosphatidylcholine transfer protein [Neospora caninum Liverpool]